MATPVTVDIELEPGTILLGKYRVESILGQGGMGVVAKCTHLALGEAVAIKMLRADVLLDEEAVNRFEREARAASRLKSEYVARVTDVGTTDGGVPYMVMEYLDGQDLGQMLDDSGTLLEPWACELMMQTAYALAEAHSIGIVHRDIKPTNLFVTNRPDGSALIKVLDFGISKVAMGTDMQLTQTQSLLGTPAYMSPEQMRSAHRVDARTDVWSLGTVLYELIEGHRPFEAESFSEMCVKVAVDPPTTMVRASPELQRVVLRCLAKVPEQRYETMADLARDLVPLVRDPHQAVVLVERMHRVLQRTPPAGWDVVRLSGPIEAPRPITSAPTPIDGLDSAPARVASEFATISEPTKRRFPWLLGGLVAAAAATVVAVVALRGPADPSAAPPVTEPRGSVARVADAALDSPPAHERAGSGGAESGGPESERLHEVVELPKPADEVPTSTVENKVANPTKPLDKRATADGTVTTNKTVRKPPKVVPPKIVPPKVVAPQVVPTKVEPPLPQKGSAFDPFDAPRSGGKP